MTTIFNTSESGIATMDEPLNLADYIDVRRELNATGHHLTSVMANPRELSVDSLDDLDLSAPLDSPLTALISAGGFASLFTGASTHPSQHLSTGRQFTGASNHGTTAGSASFSSGGVGVLGGGSSSGAAPILALTAMELDQLARFLQRTEALTRIYVSAHGADEPDLLLCDPSSNTASITATGVSTAEVSTGSHHSTKRKGGNFTSAHASVIHSEVDGMAMAEALADATAAMTIGKPLVASNNYSEEDRKGDEVLRLCYQEVPELFFRDDFSLARQDIFDQAILSSTLTASALHVSSTSSGDVSSILPTNTSGTGAPSRLHFQYNNSSKDFTPTQASIQDSRLSRYLDLVEMALLRQIWKRSPAFFKSLTEVRRLQSTVRQASDRLRIVRERLRELQESAIRPNLALPKLSQRQQNLHAVQKRVQAMAEVCHGKAVLVSLLDGEELEEALRLLTRLRKVYNEHCVGLRAMNLVGRQLETVERGVAEVLCGRLVTMGIGWEDTPYTEVGEEERIVGSIPSSDEPLSPVNSTLENRRSEELRNLLGVLSRAEYLPAALAAYQSRLAANCRLVIATCVTEYAAGLDSLLTPSPAAAAAAATATAECGAAEWGPTGLSNTSDAHSEMAAAALAEAVRSLRPEAYLACFAMCAEQVCTSLRRAVDFHDALCARLAEVAGDSVAIDAAAAAAVAAGALSAENSPLPTDVSNANVNPLDASNPDVISQVEESSGLTASMLASLQSLSRNCVNVAADGAQRQVVFLVSVRRDLNQRLDPRALRGLWTHATAVITAVETAVRTVGDGSVTTGLSNPAAALKQCLAQQARLCLESLHGAAKGRLVHALDHERWTPCEVPADRLAAIHRLVSGRLAAMVNSSASGILASEAPVDAVGGPAHVTIDGQEFRLVWSALLLLEQTLSYLDLAFAVPAIAGDIAARLTELIRLFEARTRQLVLGAGAIQSAARLKSISAKHLAVTFQAVSCVAVFLPHLRAVLAVLLAIPTSSSNTEIASPRSVVANAGPTQLTEFSRVGAELREHQTRLAAKFVSIVGDMLEASASRLRNVDWDRLASSATTSTTAAPGSSVAAGNRCEYFEETARNIVTLHRVLAAILPPLVVKEVFTRIFALLTRRVPAHFEDLPNIPHSVSGKQRLVDEVTHLVSELTRLKGVDASSLTSLESSFRERFV